MAFFFTSGIVSYITAGFDLPRITDLYDHNACKSPPILESSADAPDSSWEVLEPLASEKHLASSINGAQPRRRGTLV